MWQTNSLSSLKQDGSLLNYKSLISDLGELLIKGMTNGYQWEGVQISAEVNEREKNWTGHLNFPSKYPTTENQLIIVRHSRVDK